MTDDQLMTISQAAQRKGVSRSAVYKAVVEGRLSSRRVLGRLALRIADVEAWRPKEQKGRRKGVPMSEDAKARIAESQRRRWALRKANLA